MIKFRCKVFSKDNNFLKETKTKVVRFVEDPKKGVGNYVDGYVEDVTETPVGTIVSSKALPIVGRKIYKKTVLPELEKDIWKVTGVDKLASDSKKTIREALSSKNIENSIKEIEESIDDSLS